MTTQVQNRSGLPDALIDERRFFALTGPGKTDTPKGWNDSENWVYLEDIPDGKPFGFDAKDSNILFIDGDHVRDPQTGKMVPWVHEVYKRITQYGETYSELSMSQTGFHMLCDPGVFADEYGKETNSYDRIIVDMNPEEYNNLPKPEQDKIPKIELFYRTGGRYIYLTGQHKKLHQLATDETAASIFNELLQVREEFHQKHGWKKDAVSASGKAFEIDDQTRQRVLEALPYISANDRETWIRVGIALRNCGFPFDVWDKWSQFTDQRSGELCDKYNPEETPKKWKSFEGTESRWNAGTIIKLAKKNGYEVQKETPSEDICVVSFASVQSKDVEWLVPYYIPKNHLTIIGGDGGSGKSSLSANIAACVSSGRTTIFEEGYSGEMIKDEGKKVLLLNAEDPMPEVLKPRLERYSANMENIVSVSLEDEVFRQIKLGSSTLEKLVAQVHPDLLILDPLQSFLMDTVVMGARNQMRNAVGHVVGLCSKYKFTSIIVVHANKGKGLYGRKRLADSGDIWDIARSVFLCGNVDKDTFYISHEKSNYSQRNKSILYALDKGRIRIKGYTDKHDREFIMNEEFGSKGAPALEEAKDFILDQLVARGEEIPVKELDDAAEAMSISKGTLGRAKAELKKDGEVIIRNTGFGSSKSWMIGISRLGIGK